MPAISASAPGKVILCGEHAVVYGRPAIAVPVTQVQAKAIISADPLATPGEVLIQAPNIGLEAHLVDLPPENPLGYAIRGVFEYLGITQPPALTVRVSATIPLAAGMGSGAAVSVAIIRALSAFLGHPLHDSQVCELAYSVEKLHHGTPSGIDNTVITYAKPVYFAKGQAIQVLPVGQSFTLLIADTGIPSPTRNVVGDVRHSWQIEHERYEQLFEQVGVIVENARKAIEKGDLEKLGNLMNANQELLRQIGVSSPELEALILASLKAGALGAKLSGAGRGGNMLALVKPETTNQIESSMQAAGARQIIITEVKHSPRNYCHSEPPVLSWR